VTSREFENVVRIVQPLVIVLVLAAPAAAETKPDLHTLLVQIAQKEERLEKLLKNTSVTRRRRTERLDGRGKLKSITEVTERIVSLDGKEQIELLRFLRDGRDVTEEERKKRSEPTASHEKTGSPPDQMKEQRQRLDNPFAQSEQSKYRFSLLEAPPAEPERLRVHFEPKELRSPEDVVGEALVESVTGALIRRRFRPAKYRSPVSEMEVQIEYGAETPAGRARSRVKFDMLAKVLMVKFRVRTTTTYTDYAFPPAP